MQQRHGQSPKDHEVRSPKMGVPSAWIYKANQYFKYYQVPNLEKILIAYYHIEGEALIWFEDFEDSFDKWKSFIKALKTIFGPTSYDGPIKSINKGEANLKCSRLQGPI
jgi:hypothetical protein